MRPDAENEPERDPDYSVLFVCMGNICRSPTVEGVFRHVVQQHWPEAVIRADSAGTHAYHVGEPPDPRAQRAASKRGIDLSSLRARRITVEDFENFDLLLAMDELNLSMMRELCPPELAPKVRRLMEFTSGRGHDDVPDPYYGGSNGFEYVLDLAEEASAGLLAHLRATVRLTRG